MEQQAQPQQPAYKSNWFVSHKVLLCFSIVALFFLSFALFNRTPNQTVIQGVSSSIPIVVPTSLPTDTPTAKPTPTAFIVPTQPPPTQAQGVSINNSIPAGATAKCADGTYSFSQHRSGTCSHHGGVTQWYN